MTAGQVTLADATFSVDSLVLSAPGKGEDVVLVRRDFIGVADGSTPLLRDLDIDAHKFAAQALENLAAGATLSVREMFKTALHSLSSMAPVTKAPSCTVGVIRPMDGDLEGAVLGDCMIVFAHHDGSHTVLQDVRLQDFDERVAQMLASHMARGLTEEEATAKVHDALIRNRDLANQPGTYWVFSGNQVAANHVLTVRVPRADIGAVLLCSDGFARLIHPFRLVEDEPALVDRAVADGLRELGEALRNAEGEPKSMVRFPRLSTSDDATALLLRRAS